MNTAHLAPLAFAIDFYKEPPFPRPVPVVDAPHVQFATLIGHGSAIRPIIPQGLSRTLDGFWQRDFKNSLFIKPSNIELGFVAGSSEHEIHMWSTFEQPLHLQSFTASGDQGLTLTGENAGAILAPFGGYWDYTVTVTDQVPVRINAKWQWTFDNATTSLSVNGTKLVIWPFPPLYPVSERWQFATVVLDTYSAEQRLSNAEWPIQTLSYRYKHHRDLAVSNEMRFALNGGFPLAVPLWLDAIPNITIQAGATEIAVTVGEREFTDSALLYHNEYDYEMVNIEAITASAIQLQGKVLNNHTNAILLPVRFAISKEGLKTNVIGRHATQEITFTNTELFTLPTAPWPLTYCERPVLANYRKQPTTDASYQWSQRRTATNMHVTFLDRNIHRQHVDIELLDNDDRHGFRRRLMAFKGRLNTVWWPSFGNEIRVTALCSRNKLVIERRGFTERWPQGMHLWLEWQDGRELVAAKPNGLDANGNEIIDIDTLNTAPVKPEDLRAGHLLYLMRCDEDEWELKHQKRHSSASLALIEVPPSEYPK